MLNVMRIDKLTDVTSECKNASQGTNASKIDIHEFKYLAQFKPYAAT